MKLLCQRKQNRRNGATMVEMAIVLPVFLTFLLGCIEIGRFMWVVNGIDHASSQASRTAGVRAGATFGDVRQQALDEVAAFGLNTSSVDVKMGINGGALSTPGDSLVFDNYPSGTRINIQVEIPYSDVTLVAPLNWLAHSDKFTAKNITIKE